MVGYGEATGNGGAWTLFSLMLQEGLNRFFESSFSQVNNRALTC